MSDIKTMPLICLRCKKDIHLSMPTFKEISYTHYSYCEECLRKGLKALEQEPIDKSAIMYEIYMEGVNMTGEYQGCWVRFKDIEKIVNKHIPERK